MRKVLGKLPYETTVQDIVRVLYEVSVDLLRSRRMIHGIVDGKPGACRCLYLSLIFRVSLHVSQCLYKATLLDEMKRRDGTTLGIASCGVIMICMLVEVIMLILSYKKLHDS